MKLNDAVHVHNNMPSANAVPDVVTFTAVLNAHTKRGKLDDAVCVHNDMPSANVVPDVLQV